MTASPLAPRILVAGIGNIFFGDDGFGSEVARRMMASEPPDGVRVTDYGIRGMHLAFDLLDGYDVTILVDAMRRGDAPGTLTVLDVTETGPEALVTPRPVDPHGMTPDAVLELAGTLGATPGRVYVVGCEPASTGETIGISPAVAGAVDAAIGAVLALIADIRAPVTASRPAAGPTAAAAEDVPVTTPGTGSTITLPISASSNTATAGHGTTDRGAT